MGDAASPPGGRKVSVGDASHVTRGRARGWQPPTGTNGRHHTPGGCHPPSPAVTRCRSRGKTHTPHPPMVGGTAPPSPQGDTQTLGDIEAEHGRVTRSGGYSVTVTQGGYVAVPLG